jgi:hypothetical protein
MYVYRDLLVPPLAAVDPRLVSWGAHISLMMMR